MPALFVVLLVVAANDPLAAGRRALDALDYEGAIRALDVVAADEAVDARVRARAYMLIAEAKFGTAHGDAERQARNAFINALDLDPTIDFEHRADASPRLLAIFDALPK